VRGSLFYELRRSCRFSITCAWSKNRQPPGGKRKQPIKKPPAKPAPIPKVATRKKIQALKQESNPKPKKKRLKVATFTKAKVATFLFL